MIVPLLQDLVQTSESKGSNQKLEGLKDWEWDVLVVALHLDKFDVVRILEENSTTCATAEESIAHNFKEIWQMFDGMLFAILFNLVGTFWIPISVGKR